VCISPSSAPRSYSMKISATKRYYRRQQRQRTHNCSAPFVESGLDVHIVHLGTMGCTGYGLPPPAPTFRGLLSPLGSPARMAPGPREDSPPTDPAAVYQQTKTLETNAVLLLQKTNNIRVTEISSGRLANQYDSLTAIPGWSTASITTGDYGNGAQTVSDAGPR